MNEKSIVLLDTVRQQYASVVWTHKIQEKQAEIYQSQYKTLETLNIILAALTTCGIVSTVFSDGLVYKIITALFSFLTMAIAAYNKSFDIKGLSQNNKLSAKQFVVIRNEMLQIITDIYMSEKDNETINEEFQKIMEKLNRLYIDAPNTSKKAVEKAEMALKQNKEYTYSDEDIDAFLPYELQKKNKA